MAAEWNPAPVSRRAPRGDAGDHRTRTRLSWGCGGFLLGVLLSVIGLVFLAPQPHSVSLSPAAPSHITVTVDDQYLTRLVAQGVQSANLTGFTITDVKAHIAPSNVLSFSGSVASGPVTSLVALAAQGQISASGGIIVVSNISGSLGGLTLPAAADSALAFGINLAIANERQRLTQGGIKYIVEGVSSTDGRLTITLSFV